MEGKKGREETLAVWPLQREGGACSQQKEGDEADVERSREGTHCSLLLILLLTPAHPSPGPGLGRLPKEKLRGRSRCETAKVGLGEPSGGWQTN